MTPFQQIKSSVDDAARSSGHAPPILVAVSKTKTVDQILEVYQQGHRVFGENYVQELIDKSEDLRARGISDLQFHFIGHLQRNKVRAVLPHVTLIHSVGSTRLIEEIDQSARALGWDGGILIQVNLDAEPSKGGFLPEDLTALASWVERHSLQVRIQGLMCIPDPSKDTLGAFARLRRLRDQFAGQLGAGLSMGMSSDYREAIAEGSTYLRIGSAIFGERAKKA